MARPVKIITVEGYWGRHRLTKITELQPSIFSVSHVFFAVFLFWVFHVYLIFRG